MGLSFQTDIHGKTEIEPNDLIHVHDGDEEISLTEFMQAWAGCKNQILALHPDEVRQGNENNRAKKAAFY